MKSKIYLIICLIFTQSLNGQDYYYYKAEKIPIELCLDKVLIRMNTTCNIAQEKINLISTIPSLRLEQNAKMLHENMIFMETVNVMNRNKYNQILDAIKNIDEVEHIHSFFRKKDGTELCSSNQFVVKLKANTSLFDFEELVKSTYTYIQQKDKYDPNTYILSIAKQSNRSIIEVANLFFESGLFDYSEPNFKQKANHYTNDEFYSQQWHLSNSGQHGGTIGADIKISQAWEVTEGADYIKVAVIDEGVQLDHPDLVNRLLPGFDATGIGTNGGPINSVTNHGTRVAGIISAESNNGIGIAGVAPKCSMIPISIEIVESFDPLKAANAINWAWDEGEADVLCCSWGIPTTSSYLEDAIYNAYTYGRQGLGSIVIFAAGNENEPNISYPANLPSTIAVGATDMCDERLDPTPCDGGTIAAGSNRGFELDLVAPGRKIMTTDINSSYVEATGTSMAAPIVAGIAALMLSIHRCLTVDEVKNILAMSCDKPTFMSPWTNSNICYNYSPTKPSGTWNEEMGYGRVNAFKAIQYAHSLNVTSASNLAGSIYDSSSQSFQWNLTNSGCSNFASGQYSVLRYEIYKDVTFPYASNPFITVSSNGLSAASPNSGAFWAQALNVTNTSARLRTFVYLILSSSGGSQIGWIPESPLDVRFNYHVVDPVSTNIYLQNAIESTGTLVYNAMNNIEAGYNVTSTIANGDYVIDGDANVTLQAGNSICLKPGTIILSNEGSFFHAKVGPFFVCDQFPEGKNLTANTQESLLSINDFNSVFVQNEKDDLLSLQAKGIGLTSSPNPFSDFMRINYILEESEQVYVALYDIQGKPKYVLENYVFKESGEHEIFLQNINLTSGTYFCILRTPTKSKNITLVKVK
jgi:hypothetical protein